MKQFQKKLQLGDSLVRGRAQQDRSNIEESFKSATSFLKVFVTKLDTKLEEKIRDAESIRHYLTPNWSLTQADNRGYRRALRDVMSMLIEKEK